MVDHLDQRQSGIRAYAGSLLDRLIDREPELQKEQARSAHQELTLVREGIRRDLEMILNRRAPITQAPEGLEDLSDSLVCLGVGDMFTAPLLTEMDRKAFARALEERITRFEPRLKKTKVDVLPSVDPSHRSLRLRISAEFAPQPGVPALVFDSQLDPSTHRFKVEEAGGV